MSSENKGLFEEILADETLAGVAEYLYDNTDVTIDRRGNVIDYVDVPDIEFAENYAYISEEDYNKIAEAIREQAKNVRYYDGYILLNDNHTLHKIDNPESDEYDYSTSVEDACEAFRLETGLSLYLLGRSGRRVCVEDSFSSFVNYDYLKEVQEKLENEVIAKHTVNESANEQVFYAIDTIGDSKENNRTYTQLQLYDFAKELIDIEEESSDKSQYKNRPKLTKNLNDIKSVLNWFNYEVKDAGMELTEDIDTTQFIIVGITKDGNRQFYNVSSAPHWVDDCDDATIFDDQAEAHKIFYEINKKPFKRVFVPNFDRVALKEELDINKIDEDEFLTVTEQIASFLKGMDMDMDDVSGKITHYDVNMFTDCCEDRIRIKWTSYMDKKRVKSNSKILPAMLTQMMADDTRFDEVVDIFINEVDNEVIHNSDLGAISVEMIASDEFEPKTKVEEVKEAYVHARSEDDIREIDTGLTHKIDYIILGDVQGQLSDGIWENSPAMNKYWKHLDTEFKDGKVFIVVNNRGHMEDVYRGTRRDYRFLESPFRHMSDDEIKKWMANKIKQIAKHEAQDNDNAPEYAWRADNDTELEYFDSVVTVADAYRTWSKLLGRPVKNPINNIIIKTTPELEIGDVVNGKVLTEIKPDEKDNYWSYLVFENGDEQKVGKHQNHKVNKPTEETFNESVEDDNKFAQYVFPLFTEEDREKAKYYGLVIDDEDEDNSYVSGSYKDIKSFADNYLGYELVDDYLTLYESKELVESTGADAKAIANAINDANDSEKHDMIKTIIDAVPDNLIDDVIDIAGKKLKGKKFSENEKENTIKQLGVDEENLPETDDIGDFILSIFNGKFAKENPETTKTLILTILWIIAAIEPTPILEIISSVISFIPADILVEVLDILNTLSPSGAIAKLITKNKEKNESVYAEEPASKEEIELELKNITHNFTNRQGTAKCSFKEEADIGYDILKQYYDKVRVEEQGEWYHLIYKDLLELDESIKEDVGADDEVIIGLYGDEVSGFDSVDQLAKSFEDNGIEVIYKSGDMEYGWDLEVKGNARDIYRLVNGKLTGYNCNSTQEFVDRYRIDESKCTNESLLQDLQKDHNAVKDTYGQEVYDVLNTYIENGNDLGDVLYKESEWNKFVDWAKKEKGIEVKSDVNESKFIKESKEKVKDILSRQLGNGKVKPFKDAKDCPRGFAFKSSNGYSGQVRYNGKDYVFAVVDGELRVMTDAEAGWNWSETIYKK